MTTALDDNTKQAKYPSGVIMHGEGDALKGMTITTPAQGDSKYTTTIADMASACRMVACLHSLLCEKDDAIDEAKALVESCRADMAKLRAVVEDHPA